MLWYHYVVLICAIAALALGAYALYRTYNITPDDLVSNQGGSSDNVTIN